MITKQDPTNYMLFIRNTPEATLKIKEQIEYNKQMETKSQAQQS